MVAVVLSPATKHSRKYYWTIIALVVVAAMMLWNVNTFLGDEAADSLFGLTAFEFPTKNHPEPELSCPPPLPPLIKVGQTIWMPAFPGSGSELCRELVQALTGISGADAYEHDGCRGDNPKPPTCKTHWPALRRGQTGDPTHTHGFHSTAILLLRHPLDAIPSFFNFWHEYHTNQQHHSQQAPQELWVTWRDKEIDRQLRKWKKMVTTWVHGQPNLTAHQTIQSVRFLPYEDLIHPREGPVRLQELATELQKAGTTLNHTAVDCLWRTIVQERHSKLRKRKYQPEFTPAQHAAIRQVLKDLLEMSKSTRDLVDILESYLRRFDGTSQP